MRWISVKDKLPDEGVLVDCLLGNRRVVTQLKRYGNLWFVPDGSMYVYYVPSFWKEPEAKQLPL
jgi:hypothetical protein